MEQIELQTFVRETLLQIVHGIAEAQAVTLPKHAEICPVVQIYLGEKDERLIGVNEKRSPIFTIEFDVSVSASKTTGKKGGLSVSIPVVSVDAGGHSDRTSSSVGRVKFKVPIVYSGKVYDEVQPEETWGTDLKNS